MKLARWATGRQYIIGVLQLLPRPFVRVGVAHRVEGDVPGRIRTTVARRLHAYYGDGRDMQMAPGSAEDGFPTIDYIEHFLFKQDGLRRSRWRRSSSSRCSARAATSCRPTDG